MGFLRPSKQIQGLWLNEAETASLQILSVHHVPVTLLLMLFLRCTQHCTLNHIIQCKNKMWESQWNSPESLWHWKWHEHKKTKDQNLADLPIFINLFGTAIKFVYFRGWGGKILVNKLALTLDWRHLLVSKHYVAVGHTGMSHNWHMLGDHFSCPSAFWALHSAKSIAVWCQKLKVVLCYEFAPPKQLTKDSYLLCRGPFRSSHKLKEIKYLIGKDDLASQQSIFTHSTFHIAIFDSEEIPMLEQLPNIFIILCPVHLSSFQNQKFLQRVLFWIPSWCSQQCEWGCSRTWCCRKLHNDELQDLYSSPNSINYDQIKKVEIGRACCIQGFRWKTWREKITWKIKA